MLANENKHPDTRKNIIELEFDNEKIAKSNLVGNLMFEEEKRQVKEMLEKKMNVNIYGDDGNWTNKLGKEIIDVRDIKLNDLSEKTVDYITLFKYLININLKEEEEEEIGKRIEQLEVNQIVNRRIISIGNYNERTMDAFQWLWEKEIMIEGLAKSEKEIKYNDVILNRDQQIIYNAGFTELETSWITGWFIDLKYKIDEPLMFKNDYQYRNMIISREDYSYVVDLDDGMFKTLKDFKIKTELIFPILTILKINPLKEITYEEGKYAIYQRIEVIDQLIKTIENCQVPSDLYDLLKTMLHYICFQTCFLNIKNKQEKEEERYIVSSKMLIKVMNQEELENMENEDKGFINEYNNKINEVKNISKSNLPKEISEQLINTENVIANIITFLKVDGENKIKGNLPNLFDYIKLIKNEYHKLIKKCKFDFIFIPNKLKENEEENKEEEKEIVKEIDGEEKKSTFWKLWKYFSEYMPLSLRSVEKEILNEYSKFRNYSNSTIFQKYISLLSLLLRGVIHLSQDEYDYINYSLYYMGILSDYQKSVEYSMFLNKMRFITTLCDNPNGEEITNILFGIRAKKENCVCEKIKLSNQDIILFVTATYMYLFNNRFIDTDICEEEEKEINIVKNTSNKLNRDDTIISNAELCLQNLNQNEEQDFELQVVAINNVLKVVRETINEFDNGQQKYDGTTIMANIIGLEDIYEEKTKRNIEDKYLCRLCCGYCQEACFRKGRMANQNCPYYNSNNFSMCIYCREIDKEHNTGYVEDLFENFNSNKRMSSLDTRHTISSCSIFKQKFTTYMEKYIQLIISKQTKINILDCITMFIMGPENGIIQNLLKQNNTRLRIAWEMVTVVYRLVNKYIQSNLYSVISNKGFSYDIDAVLIRPKNYKEIQSWLYWIAKNLVRYKNEVMSNIIKVLSEQSLSWEDWIKNQLKTWSLYLKLEIDENFNFRMEKFTWQFIKQDNILNLKMNDNMYLMNILNRNQTIITNNYLGVKRKNNTIGTTTINRIDNIKLESKRSTSSNVRKRVKLKSIEELNQSKLNENE